MFLAHCISHWLQLSHREECVGVGMLQEATAYTTGEGEVQNRMLAAFNFDSILSQGKGKLWGMVILLGGKDIYYLAMANLW